MNTIRIDTPVIRFSSKILFNYALIRSFHPVDAIVIHGLTRRQTIIVPPGVGRPVGVNRDDFRCIIEGLWKADRPGNSRSRVYMWS